MRKLSNNILQQSREELAQELNLAQYDLLLKSVSGSKKEVLEAYNREVIADSNLAYYDELISHQHTSAKKIH
jgi:hypothetical protein